MEFVQFLLWLFARFSYFAKSGADDYVAKFSFMKMPSLKQFVMSSSTGHKGAQRFLLYQTKNKRTQCITFL
jgi:hypothetical protein